MRLFHLSFKNNLEGVWEPMLPDGIKPEEAEFPEPNIARISCSDSIEKCYQAIYPNISKLFEVDKFPSLDFYVYSPKLKGKERILTPTYLTENRLVHDAHITREHCILDSVYMDRISKIRILNTNKNPDLNYKPFNDEDQKERYLAPANIIWKELKNYKNIALEALPFFTKW